MVSLFEYKQYLDIANILVHRRVKIKGFFMYFFDNIIVIEIGDNILDDPSSTITLLDGPTLVSRDK